VSRPAGYATRNDTTPAMVRPRPTCAARRPTTWVKNTALPVMKVPSAAANISDCSASRRDSGVGGIRRATTPCTGEGTTEMPPRGDTVRHMDFPAPGAAIAALDAWLADGVDPWIVETSGSTGRPKRVMLSRRAVDTSIEASAGRLGAAGRWLLAL